MVCILLSIIKDLPCSRLKEKIAEQISPPQRSAFTTDLYPALAREQGFDGIDLPQPTIAGVALI